MNLPGHYEIIEKLGQGGMGVVYKAYDQKLQRFVAIKVLSAHLIDDSDAKERLLREARTASGLQHPNICTIYSIDETNEGEPLIVMAYYRGETIHDCLKQGILAVRDTLQIIAQLTNGLFYAHQQGIIHRDIKPANIFLPENDQAKILDFGLAKYMNATRLTRSGVTLGTAAYMSPEQALGNPVDHRADIWSLGIMAYQMLLGKLPFKGENDQAMIRAILNDDPLPLSLSETELPDSIKSDLNRMIVKNPEERMQTLEELLGSLESAGYWQQVNSSGSRSRPIPSPEPRFLDFRIRRIWAGLMVSGLLALLVWIYWPFPKEQPIGVNFIIGSTTSQEIDDLWQEIKHQLGQSVYIKMYENVNSSTSVATIEFELKLEKNTPGDSLISIQLINRGTGEVSRLESFSTKGKSKTMINRIRLFLEMEATNQASKELKVNEVAKITGSLDAYHKYKEGLALFSQYEFRQAIKYYRDALEHDPEMAIAYADLATIYHNLGERPLLPDAVANARRFAESLPDIQQFEVLLKCARADKKFDEVGEYLRELTLLESDAENGHFNEAGILQHIGERSKEQSFTTDRRSIYPVMPNPVTTNI